MPEHTLECRDRRRDDDRSGRLRPGRGRTARRGAGLPRRRALVLGANQAARAFFGNRPKIVGRPIREVYPEITGQQLIQLLDRVLNTGEPFTAHEWRIMVDDHPDGDERFVTFWLVPLAGPDGRRCGVGCQFVDVTAEVRIRQSIENDTESLRRRYAAAHDVVLTLQRNLLPAGLPVLPGVRIAAHYLVAAAEQAAGGDWFEAVPVDGRVVAVVGDVVGHGAEASAVMGQLRAVLVEFLLDGDDLPTALARLDRFASRMPGARGATVCLAIVDPDDRSVRYACAGHPPPLGDRVGRGRPLSAGARRWPAQPGRTTAAGRHRLAGPRRSAVALLRRAGRAARPGTGDRAGRAGRRRVRGHAGPAPRPCRSTTRPTGWPNSPWNG